MGPQSGEHFGRQDASVFHLNPSHIFANLVSEYRNSRLCDILITHFF